jgi:hypothetical protein
MNDEASDAADLQFARDAEEIGAIILENVTAMAGREGRPVEPVDFIKGASGLLGGAWNLAKLAGPEHRAFYVELLRKHADAIQREAS